MPLDGTPRRGNEKESDPPDAGDPVSSDLANRIKNQILHEADSKLCYERARVGRRGRCCGADLLAWRRRPDSAPAPRLLAVMDHIHQAPMPCHAGGKRRITDKEAPRFATTPLH